MVASANMWVKFFQAAGVPSSTAATYAHIFCENRMELDMLMDLNKEYLREMGISPMGDIISILRHAKKVSEQNARERVLAAEKQSVATLTVSPLVSSAVSSNSCTANPIDTKHTTSEGPPVKPARRVLPEHEGKYKIKFPSGNTERSKQILAKKATLTQSNEPKKKGIFDRLEAQDQTIQTSTKLVNKPISSSIFSRLGGKSQKDDEDVSDIAFAGIFKNVPGKLDGVKKTTVNKHKVILVKKIPAKAATMIADEYDKSLRMETGEKSVSFSTEDEILEIESRRIQARPNKNRPVNNVRARLGMTATSSHLKHQNSSNRTELHRTHRIKLKQPLKRANGAPIKTAGLKSDQMVKSVKNRLSLKESIVASKPDVNKLVNRIGRVTMTSRLERNPVDTVNDEKTKSKAIAVASVFDRLGFSKK